jgi:CheY-like chemotaxis protein
MKLLIVEDNAPMREMIRLISSRPGDEVHECADGDEVLEAYARWQPDWVTMDIHMSRLDGLSATRRLKEQFPAARIVFVTQVDNQTFRDAAQQLGAEGYVLKERLADLKRVFRGENSVGLAGVQPPILPPG